MSESKWKEYCGCKHPVTWEQDEPSSQPVDDESMDFQSVKYARKIVAPPPGVIKSDPDPDMPKPDMADGSYSTKQGNLLIIYKQKQEGGVREEE